MTDTTREAVERKLDFLCGAGPDENGRWFDGVGQPRRGAFWWRTDVKELVRTLLRERDEALAREAAAYEAAADIVVGGGIPQAILALTPADAKAALDRLIAEAVAADREAQVGDGR